MRQGETAGVGAHGGALLPKMPDSAVESSSGREEVRGQQGRPQPAVTKSGTRKSPADGRWAFSIPPEEGRSSPTDPPP
jgi:hypothetical protein